MPNKHLLTERTSEPTLQSGAPSIPHSNFPLPQTWALASAPVNTQPQASEGLSLPPERSAGPEDGQQGLSLSGPIHSSASTLAILRTMLLTTPADVSSFSAPARATHSHEPLRAVPCPLTRDG